MSMGWRKTHVLIEHMPALMPANKHRPSVAVVLDVVDGVQHAPAGDKVVFVGVVLDVGYDLLGLLLYS